MILALSLSGALAAVPPIDAPVNDTAEVLDAGEVQALKHVRLVGRAGGCQKRTDNGQRRFYADCTALVRRAPRLQPDVQQLGIGIGLGRRRLGRWGRSIRWGWSVRELVISRSARRAWTGTPSRSR